MDLWIYLWIYRLAAYPPIGSPALRLFGSSARRLAGSRARGLAPRLLPTTRKLLFRNLFLLPMGWRVSYLWCLPTRYRVLRKE